MKQAKFGTWRRTALALLLSLTVFGSADASASEAVQTAAGLPETLIPVGHAVGIKLFSDGVLVVGLAELETAGGQAAPAKDCGLKVGDLILQADGTEIRSTEHFQSLVQEEAGRPVMLQIKRGSKLMELEAGCIQDESGVWRLGAWIRDSLAGIGTMTFYDPASNVFGTLGHGINDVDTAKLMPLETGSIMGATVSDVKKGTAGEPGELHGDFDLTTDLGTLYANTDRGIFGYLEEGILSQALTPVEVAAREEVQVGEATILSNVAGDTVEEYTVEITHLYPESQGESRNLMLQVTDPRLLEATGGIVQGMSGSPILQNGKLVGAVTHVLVNDPTRGYGILAENMVQTAETGQTGAA